VTPAQPPPNQPIDAVYTWAGGEALLRFSLRSLDRYAPWIRKVHLVTAGPAPGWIHAGHPRIAAVRHEDIFRDRGALPTGNPEALAWQLFRIPGLSRQFLYFDRSFFLGRPLAAQDFLSPKGGYRILTQDADVPPASAAARLLNSRFGNRPTRKKPAGAPRLLDRDLLEEVHRLWEKQIKQTSAHRSPEPDDVSMDSLYFHYLLECPQQYGVHEQAAVTRAHFDAVPAAEARQVAGVLLRQPQFFCLDGGVGEPGAMTRLLLNLFYWRRSSMESE
jgi:hypothetical protein